MVGDRGIEVVGGFPGGSWRYDFGAGKNLPKEN